MLRLRRLTAARGVPVAAVLLVMLVLLDLVVIAGRLRTPATTGAATNSCPTSPLSVTTTSDKGAIAEAAATVGASVVSLTATSNAQVDIGSGVVIRADGLILTNNHLVAAVAVNGGSVEVSLASGRTTSATIVGRVPAHDIALVRAKGWQRLAVAPLSSSTALKVGDTVLAIGNALGQSGTVTAGIVSALDRTACVTSSPAPDSGTDLFGTQPSLPDETTLTDLIQTDAPINPGNSGGALVDLSGHVVGITTLALGTGTSSGSVGIGFAIPIENAYGDARRLLAQATK